ncbi:unnamed protein product [Eruca vesicaria subsp. sativa]|uniref:Uncharacterized protein n=1 Tax=Eruca vesicaria subsp. sativa TaxID=29727 RepID=A0ABC8KU32_ERUVS|nr:unnamed protein product [Eruca vesicaria subsp. sativa]
MDDIHNKIFAIAANFPPNKLTYPTISTFTPCFISIFYYLNNMDHLMTFTDRWTNNCMGWVPPYSQIYICMLLYIQTMRAMQASGYLLPSLSSLLGDFCHQFPLQNLWIPVFHATTHLPNLNIFISRLNSICAAATRPNVTFQLFSSDVDGPSYMANLFRQPCDQSDNEHANLTSPGACLTYPGSLDLWQEANFQLPFLNIPQPLDVNSTEVNDNWSSFLRLAEDSSWFGSVAAMMATYCMFWKGSVPLYDCSASSSAAGSVRCTATDTNVFDPPKWTAEAGNHNATQHDNPHQVGHYSMRCDLSLVFNAATSLDDISLNQINAGNTYNIYLSPNDDGHATLRRGVFWSIYPDAFTRSGIEVYRAVIPIIAREYHSYSRIDSDELSETSMLYPRTFG